MASRDKINLKLAPVPSFSIGDTVLLMCNRIIARGMVLKSLKYSGLYIIIGKRDQCSYTIKNLEHSHELSNIHVSHLLHFNVDPHITPAHLLPTTIFSESTE